MKEKIKFSNQYQYYQKSLLVYLITYFIVILFTILIIRAILIKSNLHYLLLAHIVVASIIFLTPVFSYLYKLFEINKNIGNYESYQTTIIKISQKKFPFANYFMIELEIKGLDKKLETKLYKTSNDIKYKEDDKLDVLYNKEINSLLII